MLEVNFRPLIVSVGWLIFDLSIFLVWIGQSNKGLCERFNVQSYPTMYIGPPEILASGSFASRGKKGLDSVEGGDVATGDDLLQWINKRINKWASTLISPYFPSDFPSKAQETEFRCLRFLQDLVYMLIVSNRTLLFFWSPCYDWKCSNFCRCWLTLN